MSLPVSSSSKTQKQRPRQNRGWQRPGASPPSQPEGLRDSPSSATPQTLCRSSSATSRSIPHRGSSAKAAAATSREEKAKPHQRSLKWVSPRVAVRLVTRLDVIQKGFLVHGCLVEVSLKPRLGAMRKLLKPFCRGKLLEFLEKLKNKRASQKRWVLLGYKREAKPS